MICNMERTGETSHTGKPIWRCSKCGRSLPSRSGNIAPEECGTEPSKLEGPLRHTAETLPCIHRGEPTGDKVSCGCGNRAATIDVYRCAQFAICTVISPARVTRIGRTKPAVCLGCEMRATS